MVGSSQLNCGTPEKISISSPTALSLSILKGREMIAASLRNNKEENRNF